MADLDDFFAKKDRKKSKSKKFLTNEELAKKLEDTTRKTESKPRKERPVDSDEPDNEDAQNPNDDEWKDFAEEERKDYTGLKIGQMQINDDDLSNTGTDGEGQEYGSDGELNSENSEKRAGPWKKVSDKTSTQQPTAAAAAATAAAAVADKPAVVETYISPALRRAQEQKARLKKGVLPDITNEEYFPTLGSAKPEEIKKKKPEPGFEEVRHGGRMQRSSDLPTHAPVSIGNRFNSLADS